MLVVVGLVLTQHPQEMPLIPDQGAAGQLPPASADPPLHDRVRPGCLHRARENADVRGMQDLAEGSGELGVAVTDQELDRLKLAVQVHQQVAGLLGHPRAGGVRRDAEDADAPAGVLNHREDTAGRAIAQTDGEEARGQDGYCRGAQELAHLGPARRGAGPGPAFFSASHTVDGAMRMPRPASSP